MQRTLVFLLALVALTSVAQAAWVETVYTATLSPDQVVPFTSGAPPFGGTLVCVLDRNASPQTLDCELQSTVTDVESVEIHQGSRGQNGALLYSFDNTFKLGFHVRETFTLVEQVSYTIDEQVSDFLNGQWYIVINSGDFAGGVIRGQLEHVDRVYSRMNVRNTIPRASGTSASGVAVATYTFFNPSRTVQLDFVHNVQRPSGVEVRLGRPGEVGPLVYFFEDSRSAVFHSVEYTISEEENLLDDLQYLQILSETNPNGEIRGQLIAIDYVPEIAFTSRINGRQQVPDVDTENRGCGLVAYDCATRTLEYLVMHNVPDATAGFVHAASRGNTGAVLFGLARGESPIYGSVVLTLEEELILYTQQMYFNIISEEFPSGEIRGQITADNDWWAYLSGTNVVPPVTTEAVGCATFFLDGQQNRILNYDIHHSVSAPRAVTLNVGEEGQNGDFDIAFPSFFSPVRGDSIVLDDDDLEAYVTDSAYITVLSEDFPFGGELRGTIKRINPCRATNDNSLTLSVSGIDGGSRSNPAGSPLSNSRYTYSFSPNASPRSPGSPNTFSQSTYSYGGSPNGSPNTFSNSPNASPNGSPNGSPNTFSNSPNGSPNTFSNSPNASPGTVSFSPNFSLSPISPDSPNSPGVAFSPNEGTPIRVGIDVSTRDTFSRRFLPPDSFFSSENIRDGLSAASGLSAPIYFSTILAVLALCFM